MTIIETFYGGVKIDNLVGKSVDINSQELTIDETAGSHVFVNLSQKAELVKLKYVITEEFDGALKLGNADTDDAYIADASFPKAAGTDVILLNTILAAAADITLTVSGCTTGAGWFKLVWEV